MKWFLFDKTVNLQIYRIFIRERERENVFNNIQLYGLDVTVFHEMIILISHEAQSRSCCWLHAINLRPFIWWSLVVAEITTFHFRPYINDRINQKSSLTRSILIQWNRNGVHVFLAASSSINEYKGCPF